MVAMPLLHVQAARLAARSEDFRSAAFHARQAARRRDQQCPKRESRALARIASKEFLVCRANIALDRGEYGRAAMYFAAAAEKIVRTGEVTKNQ